MKTKDEIPEVIIGGKPDMKYAWSVLLKLEENDRIHLKSTMKWISKLERMIRLFGSFGVRVKSRNTQKTQLHDFEVDEVIVQLEKIPAIQRG